MSEEGMRQNRRLSTKADKPRKPDALGKRGHGSRFFAVTRPQSPLRAAGLGHPALLLPRRQTARQAAIAAAATVIAGSGTTVIAPANQLDPSVS